MKNQERIALLMTLQVLLTSMVTYGVKNVKIFNKNEIIDKPKKTDDLKPKKIIENSKIELTTQELDVTQELDTKEELDEKPLVEEIIEYTETKEEHVEVSSVDNEIYEVAEENVEEEFIEEETSSTNLIPTELPTDEITIVNQILLDDKLLGSHGRLYFNNLCSVGLNYVSLFEEEITQKVVDDKDSAAIFNFGNCVVIADHKNQEFHELKNIQVGDTVFIKYMNCMIDSYTCIEKSNGKNTGYELIMEDGRYISEISDCDIVMYTCNDNWHNVTITLWKKDLELNKILIK